MKAVWRERDTFGKAIKRVFDLYKKLSKAKIEEKPGRLRGLRAPDQRDLAQFLFLDVAAQWEAFCVSVFALELKKLYHVRDEVAERMMGSVDGVRIQGYADPDKIIERAKVMLGTTSPWVSLERELGLHVVNYLTHGQTIRARATVAIVYRRVGFFFVPMLINCCEKPLGNPLLVFPAI